MGEIPMLFYSSEPPGEMTTLRIGRPLTPEEQAFWDKVLAKLTEVDRSSSATLQVLLKGSKKCDF